MQNDLWKDWILFKDNPTLQLRKQGNDKQNDKFQDFSIRQNDQSSPCLQEYYESLLKGIMIRYQLGLYKGSFQYYCELQYCLREYCRQVNYKQKLLLELFQQITQLQVSKEANPQIVVTCEYCKTSIYINFHCKKCFLVYYCDVSCLKNDRQKHEQQCEQLIKPTPSIFQPLQVEIHIGSDIKNTIIISFEHEMRITLKNRGQFFINVFNQNFKEFFELLIDYTWFQKNNYEIIKENSEEIKLILKESQNIEIKDEDDDDIFLKNLAIQELKLILLNQGGILQDIIKEPFENYNHFVYIFYLPA